MLAPVCEWRSPSGRDRESSPVSVALSRPQEVGWAPQAPLLLPAAIARASDGAHALCLEKGAGSPSGCPSSSGQKPSHPGHAGQSRAWAVPRCPGSSLPPAPAPDPSAATHGGLPGISVPCVFGKAFWKMASAPGLRKQFVTLSQKAILETTFRYSRVPVNAYPAAPTGSVSGEASAGRSPARGVERPPACVAEALVCKSQLEHQ